MRIVCLTACVAICCVGELRASEIRWHHPGGLVTRATFDEIREKLATQEWARRTWQQREKALQRWITVDSETLSRVFPRRRGNVYHNFSCPTDRRRLTFDPFKIDEFTCPSCGHTYKPDTDAGIYPKGDRYHGTMYDGWVCLFFIEAGDVAADLALIGTVTNRPDLLKRGVEILMLHADTLEHLPTRPDPDPQMRVILTYHREGDNKVLYDLARAYELLREQMSAEQRARFEKAVLRRMLDDIMLEPAYKYEHNNLYQWHRTIVQAGIALERSDLIDWSIGQGDFDAAHLPEHRSIRRLAATHFKKDGAFWEMCSGYHLYPMHYFCELAIISHHLSQMDPIRFPADRYDLTASSNEVAGTIKNALEWFLSMAMPDRTMPTIGDSMSPRAGMTDYYVTAEAGYRYFDVKGVGDYESLRRGERSWAALLYGAPQIAKSDQPLHSSFLSSGWVSLRSAYGGNHVWVGLNALIPGGGHQHADRLTLLLYSRGQLLALEKATPYNELAIRELATLSPMHNTVTVDGASQKQGEALKGDEIPRVARFFDSPVLRFAELRADRLYPQTKLYRRSVAIVDDVVIDVFRVQGGRTHDWMLHHAGREPQLSLETRPVDFVPAAWLTNGAPAVRGASTNGTWSARWQVQDVTSRLTMLDAPATGVFSLQTYPVDNAVVTPTNPPCSSLCVRRESNDSRFTAVWDSWIGDQPRVRDIAASRTGEGLSIQTQGHCWYVVTAPGDVAFTDGTTLATDAAWAIFGSHGALAMIGGSRLDIRTGHGDLSLQTNAPATLSMQLVDARVAQQVSADIQYDTYGGIDHPRP